MKNLLHSYMRQVKRVVNVIGSKYGVNLGMDRATDKMTGKLKITATPTEADDVVDKEYVDAIIPAYTVADNGKVRGVVDGKLAWVTKA